LKQSTGRAAIESFSIGRARKIALNAAETADPSRIAGDLGARAGADPRAIKAATSMQMAGLR
jgi:hypothetical protein